MEPPATSSAIDTWRQRLGAWRSALVKAEFRFAPTENQRLFALTLIIGVACGLAAVAFHVSIRFLSQQGIDRVANQPGLGWVLWFLALPTAGGLLGGALLQYAFPAARGSGIPQVKVAYASPAGQIPLRDSLGKFVVSALQIGSGASLGREGPTVQICAGISTALGRLGGVSANRLRRLLPVGAAAGIAAAFNAPIAAVTFTIEEVVGTLDQTVLSGVVIAAALAAVIERSILGEHPLFDVPPGYGLQGAKSLILYAAMGVAGAGVSVAFTDMLLGVRARFKSLSQLPAWMRPAVGGLVTGVLAVAAFGVLHAEGVTGGGYATLGKALLGNLPAFVMLMLLFAKIVATAFAYGTGGAGGIFAPTLFMGGMLGGLFGSLDVALFHDSSQNLGAFALVGMGAVFAGVIRAPITSVLIIIEMTGSYGLILPLMIANTTSYVLAARLRPTPIYEALLEQDGVSLRGKRQLDSLDAIQLDASMLRNGFASVGVRSSGAELIRRAKEMPSQTLYPVLDGRKLVGVITAEDLALLGNEPELGDVVIASDVMRVPTSVSTPDTLRNAFDKMRSAGLAEIAVVDENGGLLGFIDEATIAREYLQRSGGGRR
jgi:chloride channel protein, CIC family